MNNGPFIDLFVKCFQGGNGFYAAWMNPYLEHSLLGKKFGNTECKINLCPIAEDIQKKLMFFKTNYRNIDEAAKKAEISYKLINDIGRN